MNTGPISRKFSPNLAQSYSTEFKSEESLPSLFTSSPAQVASPSARFKPSINDFNFKSPQESIILKRRFELNNNDNIESKPLKKETQEGQRVSKIFGHQPPPTLLYGHQPTLLSPTLLYARAMPVISPKTQRRAELKKKLRYIPKENPIVNAPKKPLNLNCFPNFLTARSVHEETIKKNERCRFETKIFAKNPKVTPLIAFWNNQKEATNNRRNREEKFNIINNEPLKIH